MLSIVVALCLATAPAEGLQVPPGFVVTEYAGSDLANDISCMTVDASGRVIVAGRGYVRLLLDGRAIEMATGIVDAPMGLFREGDTLFVVGDGGLWKHTLSPDGLKSIRRELIRKARTGGEHDAHAVMRGPDGWLYWLCGNTAGVDATWINSPTSPVKEPKAGCVVRFSPDFAKCEVVAHGYRNAYGFDFNPDGDLFTYDSDNERCIGLPWYEGCRFYQVVPGRHYGWLAPGPCDTWRMPPYLPAVVPPLVDTGRGSPTGVVCYRGKQFPPKYRGGFFLGDWTFGKIYHVALTPSGVGYTAKSETFLQAVGDNGFAPSALALDPTTGDLVVAIGGRGTRGAVYKIRFAGGAAGGDLEPVRPRLATKGQPYDPVFYDPRLRLVSDTLAYPGIGAKEHKGTIFEGYSRTHHEHDVLPDRIARDFPTGDPLVDREYARLLAMEKDPPSEVFWQILAQITPHSKAIDDIHYLTCVARWSTKRNTLQTKIIAEGLLNLELKFEVEKLGRDRHWPLRIGELTAALIRKDPALPEAIVRSLQFGHAGHALFATVSGMPKQHTSLLLTTHAKQRGLQDWTPALVALLDVYDVPYARKLWDRGGFEDQLLPLIAKAADPADRPKFVIGLRSPQAKVVLAALEALTRLPKSDDPDELLLLLRALRAAPDGKDGAAIRVRASALLARHTGESLGPDPAKWLARYPELAAKLGGADGVDVAAWERRLAGIDWDRGDAVRGQTVFTKTNCAACHSGGQAMGPDLRGVAARFSRADLMTTIIQPSKDVSPRYRTTLIQTTDGRSFQGLIVYEAPDGLLLQTGPATTVRIAGIESRRMSELSLMPAGLLDRASDAEVADLMAYLKSLTGKP